MATLLPAKSIVLEALELARLPQSDYGRLWKLLVNEYRDLNLNHINNVKFSKEAMDNNKIIHYPLDCVKVLNVWVAHGGELVRLTQKRIVPTVSVQNGQTVRDIEDGEGEAILVDTLGKQATPHNMLGYYYNYKRNRYLLFLTETRTEVVLEYQTSGLERDDTLIPVEYKNALLWGMIHKDTLLSKNPQWKTQDVYKMHQDELTKLRKVVMDYEAFASLWINPYTATR